MKKFAVAGTSNKHQRGKDMKKIAAAIGILVSANAFSELPHAHKAYLTGQYQTSSQHLPALTINDDQALFYYGLMKVHGYEVKKDLQQALHLITTSAQKGNTQAQEFLAKYYLNLENAPQQAFHWYEKLAQKNLPYAQLYLAAAYKFGYGTTKNTRLYRKYLVRAAKGGSGIAQYHLGNYFLEQSTDHSYKLGITWIKKAAKNNIANAYYKLAQLNEDSFSEKNHWLDKLKTLNSAHANYLIGKYYLASTHPDVKLAGISWLQKASQAEHSSALYELGIVYSTPELKLLDDKKAFKLDDRHFSC